ncbi:hypothetical protein FRC04_001840 [Tulasnella sp. 424]|nr:hypothetical protein FRC04_001840 [Tulasnella sp. 424]KAG8977623.1 hypothetical protein FRC05_000879 [Tulasnella sp. 425]
MPVLGEITNTFADALRDARAQLEKDRERTLRVVGHTRYINDEIKRREKKTRKLRAEASALIAQTQALRTEVHEIRRERESYVVKLELALPKDAKTTQLLREVKEVIEREDINVDDLREEFRTVAQQVVPEVVISPAPLATTVPQPLQDSVRRRFVYGCRARALGALVGLSIVSSFVWLLK